MEIKATRTDDVYLIEILKNGAPASGSNPISASELADVAWPEISGQIAVISGMPMVAVSSAAMKYKNVFSVVAIANPREKCAEVAHSIKAGYRLGQSIPLPVLV